VIDVIPKAIKLFTSTLNNSGFSAFLVGGSVRNYLLDLPFSDYDIATDALPQDIMKLFHTVIPTGIKHGTVTVIIMGQKIEVTTFRTDGIYTDGRRPSSIAFTSHIDYDLQRRDFTINSIAYDLQKYTFYDPNNGMADLKHKILVAIGHPFDRFSEDGLRPIRAMRFVSQLGFTIEEHTLEAMKMTLNITRSVSHERLWEELLKLIEGQYIHIALALLQQSLLLSILIPCLDKIDPSAFQALTRAIHSVPACYKLARLSILFFLADFNYIKKYYPMSNAIKNSLYHLIDCCKIPLNLNYSDHEIRKLLTKVQPEYFDEFILIKTALARYLPTSHHDLISIKAIKVQAKAILKSNPVLTIQQLAVSGQDLINIGVPRSPIMGKILQNLLEHVLQYPDTNNYQTLIKLAGQLMKTSF
jgi:tRNA nucleotidyltransferase (CCA-adding enzyme)